MYYFFQLGHQPHISTAEIEAVFSVLTIKYELIRQDKEYLVLSTSSKIDAAELIDRLGGTIKIGEQIVEDKDITEALTKHLSQLQPEGKVHFSLSGKDAQPKALQIKKLLKSQGRSVRYIEPKNVATILHNKLLAKQTDFTIIDNSIFVTRAIQSFEEFGKRDYGRPDADSLSGMLPPKLARILINLSGIKPGKILLDPFCGSGTILMEAAIMGHTNFIGSDISDRAIRDTRHNLEWLKDNFALPHLPYRLLPSDVVGLDKHLGKKSIDTIITEPLLGQPLRGRETRRDLNKQTQELKNLYITAFETFHQILKAKGTVLFIIPRFRHKNSWITIDCSREIKKIGFEIIPLSKKDNFLIYWRKKQHLGREIWKFRKV